MNRAALLMICSMLSASAQTSKEVRWSENCPTCTHAFVNGDLFKGFIADGLDITVTLKNSDQEISFLSVPFRLKNLREHPVDFLPQKSLLSVTLPKSKVLVFQEPENVAAAIRRSGNGSFIQRYVAQNATRQQRAESTTSGAGSQTGIYSGSTTTTVTVPDEEARARAQRSLDVKAGTADGRAAALLSNALRANTVQPNQQIMGFLYFERNKDFKKGVVGSLEFQIEIDGTLYIFPFSAK